MSRWSWYEPAPKQPVPEDGLRVDRFGVTWWGKQWITALDRLGHAYSNRLPRGRSYARAGRVVDLAMGAGEATAGVVGTRRKPYEVRIGLKTFSKSQWKRVIDVLAGRARITVALLRGELPAQIGESLQTHGIQLFPLSKTDLETSCSCPDWANPCKHVAAVHYVLAAALDMDPFLIFVLRGLGREAVLAAVAEARGMAAPPPRQPADSTPTETLWETPDEVDEDLFLGRGLPRPQLAFRVAPAVVELAGLARLGPPPLALEDLPKRLKRGIRQAARASLVLSRERGATGKGISEDDDEAVREHALATIRSHPEGATMLLIRSRLPYEKKVLHRVVHAMRKEGIVESRGRGAATRYTVVAPPDTPRSDLPSTRPKGRQKTPAPHRRRASGGRKPESLTERILTTLASANEPLPLREIARRLDCAVDARLRTAMTSLRSTGPVTMTGNRRTARYSLTQPQKQPPRRPR